MSDGPCRAYRLERREEPGAGITRVALGRIASARDHLTDTDGDVAKSVHESRKDMKKLRSLLRLVREDLGEKRYGAENGRLRTVARSLGGARDAEVKLATLRDLADRYPDDFPDGTSKLTDALEAERDRLAGEFSDPDAGPRADALRQLAVSRESLEGWEPGEDGWELIEPGLMRAYRRGRNRFEDVREEATPTNVHEWRKRVKDLWYHQRIIRNSWEPVLAASADEAHELADLLGDHHDLAVLEEDLRDRGRLVSGEDREALRDLIHRRQQELLEPALELGERVYAEQPKAFVARHRAYWLAWR